MFHVLANCWYYMIKRVNSHFLAPTSDLRLNIRFRISTIPFFSALFIGPEYDTAWSITHDLCCGYIMIIIVVIIAHRISGGIPAAFLSYTV